MYFSIFSLLLIIDELKNLHDGLFLISNFIIFPLLTVLINLSVTKLAAPLIDNETSFVPLGDQSGLVNKT